jgi:hypothetical protein
MFSIQTPLHAKGGYIRNAQSRKHTIRQAPTSPKERKTDKPDWAGYDAKKERRKEGWGIKTHLRKKQETWHFFTSRSPQHAHAHILLEIHNPRIVLQELAAIARNLRGYTAGIFNAALAQVIQDAAETVVPLLLFLVRLAWVSRAELDEEFFTCGGARRR